MTRILVTVLGWLLFGKCPLAIPVAESIDRGHDRNEQQLQSVLANFLLLNVPVSSQQLSERSANIYRNPLSPPPHYLLNGQSATKDSQRLTTLEENRSPKLREPLVPCFVPLRSPHLSKFGSARAHSPYMAVGDDVNEGGSTSLSAEWAGLQSDKVTRIGPAGDVVKGFSSVWVLVTNKGKSKECKQCVYTLPGKKLHVLAFELQGDAERYAFLVNKPNSVRRPVEWTPEKLRSLCDDEGMDVAFVDGGQFLVPTPTATQYCYEGCDIEEDLWNDWSPVDDRRAKVTQSGDLLQGAWVVLINAGQVNEGVYTLQNSDTQLILAFTEREDAKQFADKLQAGAVFDFAMPSQWDRAQLRSFCEDTGLEIYLASEGASIDMPKVNEYDIDAYSKANDKLPKDGSTRWTAPDERSIKSRDSRNDAHGSNTLMEKIKKWVVLINPGKVNEGVYTLENGKGQHLLVFEHKDDAERFAEKLQISTGFGIAAASQWETGKLKSFCNEGGYEIFEAPQGFFIPLPEVNQYDRESFENVAGAEEEQLQLERQRAALERMLSQSLKDDDFQA